MTAGATPHETFEAAQRGDQAAILKLLEKTQPDIRRYARASCRTSSDIDDATQEVLWLLSRHVGAIRAFAALSGWLFKVVQRTCIRLARNVGLIARDDGALERVLAARQESELRLDLAAAFEALPPSYREVAIMRDLHEMTIDEIGTTLGLSRQAVKAKLHRARLLLREYLAR